MADNRIRFNISSTFSGEGFDKARKSVKDVSGAVKSAGDAAKVVAGSMGELGGSIARYSDGIGKLMSAASGGIVAFAVTATSAISGWLLSWHKSIQEARKAHDKFIADMREGYERRLASYAEKAREAMMSALDASIVKGQQAIDRINALAGAYRNLSQASASAQSSQASLDSALIDLNLATAGNKGGPDERRRRELAAQAEKLQREYNARLATATATLTSANDAVGDMRSKIEIQNRVIADMTKAGKDTAKEQAKLDQMNIELAAAEDRLKAATNDRERVLVEKEAALTRVANAEEELADEIEARTVAERRAKEAAENEARLEDLRQRGEQQISDVKSSGAKRIEELDREIEDARKLARESDAMKERTRRGMEEDARRHSGISGEGYGYQTDADGNPATMKDWKRAQRYAERADRDRRNAERADDSARKAASAARERQAKGKKLTKDEQKALDDWDKREKERNGAKDAAEREKKAQKEKDEIQKQMAKDVANILSTMKKLGLK